MSLINQVLRDLEERKAPPSGSGMPTEVRPFGAQPRSYALLVLLLGGGLLIAAGLHYLALPQGVAVGFKETPVQGPLEKTVPLPAVSVEPARTLPNRLAAIRAQHSAEATRLLLEFSQAAISAPDISLAERRMRVLLPGIVLDAAQLPQLEGESPLIERLDWVPRDGLWQLELLFKADVRFDRLMLAADAFHGERLAIDIFPQTPASLDPVEKTAPSGVAAVLPPVTKPLPVATLEKQERILTAQEKADNLFQRGVAAAREQQAQTALRYWQQALEQLPEHLQARKQLIMTLLPIDQTRADKYFSDGLTLHDSRALRKWYARELLPVAGPAKAAAILGTQEVSAAEDAEYRALQAGLWQQSGDYAQAERAYLDLLAFAPDSSLYRFGLAVALDQQGDASAALESYREAVATGLGHQLQAYAQSRIEALVTLSGDRN